MPENQIDITTLHSSDVDIGDTLTFSIAGGKDSAKFSIIQQTGELSFLAKQDYESPTDTNTDGIYELTVQVNDGNGTPNAVTTKDITVTLINVNEAPTLSSTSIDSSEGFIGTIGQLEILDPDDGDSVQLTIVGGNAQPYVSYNNDTNQLTQLKQLAAGTYTLDVTLVDTDGSTSEATLTIKVQNDPNLGAAMPDSGLTGNVGNSYNTNIPDTAISGENLFIEIDEGTTSSETADASTVATPKNGVAIGSAETEKRVVSEGAYWNGLASYDSTPGPTSTVHGVAASIASIDEQTLLSEHARLINLLSGVKSSTFIAELSSLSGFQMPQILLSLNPKTTTMAFDSLQQQLDQSAQEELKQHQLSLAVSGGAVTMLTAGFVVWLLKAGVLLSAASTSAPLWRNFDPVPVLTGRREEDDEDDSGNMH